MNVIVGDVSLGVVWDVLSHCGMVLCEVTGRRKYEKGCFLLCVAKIPLLYTYCFHYYSYIQHFNEWFLRTLVMLFFFIIEVPFLCTCAGPTLFMLHMKPLQVRMHNKQPKYIYT